MWTDGCCDGLPLVDGCAIRPGRNGARPVVERAGHRESWGPGPLVSNERSRAAATRGLGRNERRQIVERACDTGLSGPSSLTLLTSTFRARLRRTAPWRATVRLPSVVHRSRCLGFSSNASTKVEEALGRRTTHLQYRDASLGSLLRMANWDAGRHLLPPSGIAIPRWPVLPGPFPVSCGPQAIAVPSGRRESDPPQHAGTQSMCNRQTSARGNASPGGLGSVATGSALPRVDGAVAAREACWQTDHAACRGCKSRTAFRR
jgi:hypothetical protein